MSSEVAIQVRGLGKKYLVARTKEKHSTLAEAAMSRAKQGFRRTERDEFWALKDLEFDVFRGDVLGIIGRNGAGKSTLLKVMSQITEPTLGEIRLWGRVGSLLEVGTGFHPELTGRENIFLNGAILGMSKRDIARQFDQIVEFSGVGKFLETPVKRYSSGMYVRLAFAVAAHLSSDILVVDEVLAVGDAEFQRKCLGKMQDVAQTGRTVLFVSHSMQAVSRLCTRAIVLNNGRVDFQGGVKDAVDRYIRLGTAPDDDDTTLRRRHGSGHYRFDWVRPAMPVFATDERKEFRFSITKHGEDLSRLILWADVVSEAEQIIAHLDSRLDGVHPRDSEKLTGEFAFSTPWLKPGRYRVDVTIRSNGLIDHLEGACFFEISPVLPYRHTVQLYEIGKPLVLADGTWRVEGQPNE